MIILLNNYVIIYCAQDFCPLQKIHFAKIMQNQHNSIILINPLSKVCLLWLGSMLILKWKTKYSKYYMSTDLLSISISTFQYHKVKKNTRWLQKFVSKLLKSLWPPHMDGAILSQGQPWRYYHLHNTVKNWFIFFLLKKSNKMQGMVTL